MNQLKVKTKCIKENLDDVQIMKWLQKQANPLFAWENPQKTTRIFACGRADLPEMKAVTFSTVEQWLTQVRPYLDLTHSSLHDVKLVGSFLFDEEDTRPQEWGELSAGLIYIPQILLCYEQDAWSLTTIADTDMDVDIIAQIKSQSPTMPPKPLLHDYHEIQPAVWEERVGQVVQQISQHELTKVVLARPASATVVDGDSSDIWLQLQQQQPQAYHILLQQNNTCFISATPEKLVAFEQNQLWTGAVAGTTKNAAETGERDRLAQQLLQDTKNLGEHQLVVDWINSNLQQLNLHVEYPKKPQILATANLQHLYTPISAQGDFSPLEVLQTLHPTPALGGVPRKAALATIRQLEFSGRGLFGAPSGYLSLDNSGEWAVGIRSGLLQEQTLKLWAGAGIVADSLPASERQETTNKLKSLLMAFEIQN